MNRMTGLSLLWFVLTTLLLSQPPKLIDHEVTRLKQELQLDSLQSGQVAQILQHSAEQAERIREVNRGNPQAMQNAMQAQQELTDRQIENILLPEQQQRFEAYRRTRISDPRAHELQTRLGLTGEQALLVEKILQQSREQMQNVRSRSLDRREKMSAMRQIMQRQDKQIEQLLSDEQKRLYDEIKKERRQQMKDQMGQGQRGRGGFRR